MKARTSVARNRQASRAAQPAPARGGEPARAPRELELKFVEPAVPAFLAACQELVAGGARTIAVGPRNEFAAALVAAASAEGLKARFVNLALGENVENVNDAANAADATVLCATEASDLSPLLLQFLDLAAGCLVAPVTAAFWRAHPLFLISIPKAGTHLLYELAQLFGYQAGVVCPSDPAPGVWYCVEYSNSHTSARDFFTDTVRRSRFGNRHHPFLKSPAIFIYRNPLDILVSEANYYHRSGKTAFSGYLANASFDDRLLRLIDDPWLFGSIRDRIGSFLPWLELDNVIPASFEELVGAPGGGSEAAQRALIWSLQLKLHVPGRPREFGRQVFRETSPTFNEGQIGAYEKHFTPEAYKKFFSLPQDFMRILGYSRGDRGSIARTSERAEAFRRRPLRVDEVRFDFPIAVEDGYRGFNIVLFKGMYVGVPQALGVVDVASPQFDQLAEQGECLRRESLEQLKESIDARFIQRVVPPVSPSSASAAASESDDTPRLVEVAYRGYNLVAYRGRVHAVSQALGPVDLETADPAILEDPGTHLVRQSVAEARQAVDLRLEEQAQSRLDAVLAAGHEREAYLEKMLATALDTLRRAEQRADDLLAGRRADETRRVDVEVELERARNETLRVKAASDEALERLAIEHLAVVGTLEETIGDLRRSVEAARSDRVEMARTIERLEADREELGRALDELRDRMGNERLESARAIDALEATVADREMKLSAATLKREELTDTADRLQRETGELRHSLQLTIAERNAARVALEQSRYAEAGAEARVAQLLAQVGEQRSDLEAGRSAIDRLSAELTAARADLVRRTEDVERLESQERVLRGWIERLQNDLVQQRARQPFRFWLGSSPQKRGRRET